MRSDLVKKGVQRAASRALLKSLGLNDNEIARPWIAVVNSWNEIVPGHVHLRKISEAVKKGIYIAGGTPFEFDTIAVCDGMIQGTIGMRYSLPSRELITDSIEIMVEAHQFDAMVLIPSCDKSVPGHLMAATRLNIPSIVVTGGPMVPGVYKGQELTLVDMRELIGAVNVGKITEEELKIIEGYACPGSGSCSMMGTANSMAAVTEALGMSLPKCATLHAVDSEKIRLAQNSGDRIISLLGDNVRPSDIMTRDAFLNAITVDMALGGSLNTCLHLPAIAYELGINIDLDTFDAISKKTPHLCPIKPAGPFTLKDLDRAGGIPAVMKEVKPLLRLDCMTVNGKTIREIIENVKILERDVIHPLENPFHTEGSITVLKGNLAPKGAVVKSVAVNPKMLKHTGPAKVFDCMEDAIDALWNHRINHGDIIVVRYEGPKGGPGMREMHMITSIMVGMELDSHVALVSDGRFSGSSRGPVIGHVSPEAIEGGLLAVVKDGDIISYDIMSRIIHLEIQEDEFKKRLERWQPPKRNVPRYLSRYSRLAASADKGAVFP
ncbi:MAG: Dihydroxy-acid dehydratase [Thermoproteota archaeon]|nr:Dihydroxy-acid dehydratase [Thermoproteota archaeon]